MKIDYDEQTDILSMTINNKPILKDVSYGWNVNIGVTEHGVGQITILDAKADGILPLQIPKNILATSNINFK